MAKGTWAFLVLLVPMVIPGCEDNKASTEIAQRAVAASSTCTCTCKCERCTARVTCERPELCGSCAKQCAEACDNGNCGALISSSGDCD
jgi:hypothetical protein